MQEEEKEETQLALKPEDKVEVVPEKPVVVQPVEDAKGEIVKLIHTAGTLEFTKEQKAILFAPVNKDDVEIRPDGLIYLPWMEYVTRLRDAFGGKWAIIPVGDPNLEDELILQEYWLLLDGKLYGKTIGEQQYYRDNYTMSWGDALEGCKSNGLMRLCKGIGISLELWKPTFIRNWKKKYAEQYYDNKKARYLWKKIDPDQPKVTTEPKVTEPSKKTATPDPAPKPTPVPEKKKAPVKVAKPTKAEITEVVKQEEYEKEQKEKEPKAEIVSANKDQKNAMKSLKHTLIDDYNEDVKELDKKMFAHVKKKFGRTIKDTDEATEQEANHLIKCLNLTVQDRHRKYIESGEPAESL